MRLLFLLPVLCLLVLSGCRREEGALYKDQLLEAIRTADAIQVTEHSNRRDFPDEGTTPDEIPLRIYRELTLPPEAVEDFHQEIRGVAAKTQEYLTACAFVDHHTIRFKKGGRTTSTMRICFRCYQLEWDGTSHGQPEALLRHLGAFLSRHGFQTERDWKALADSPEPVGNLYAPFPGSADGTEE
jgi:hypothetical protein